MKTVLTNVAQALSSVFDGLRDQDIHLLPDADMLPEGTRLPCIGIKDGEVRCSLLSGSAIERTLTVTVYCYDRLSPGNGVITGFLDKTAAVFECLHDNDLDGAVRGVTPLRETPITLMFTRAGLIVRKGLTLEYERID